MNEELRKELKKILKTILPINVPIHVIMGKSYYNWNVDTIIDVILTPQCLQLLEPLFGVSEEKALTMLKENFLDQPMPEEEEIAEALSQSKDIVKVRRE